jgi:hypothetical protein
VKLSILALALGISVYGQVTRTPTQPSRIHKTSTSSFESSINGVIAQFVDGGAWVTIVTLVNLDTAVCTYTIEFFGEDGNPLAFPTTDGTATTITGMIAVKGSHVISTLGIAQQQSTGWALVTTSPSCTIGGNAIFGQRVTGRPDFEASMPITEYLDGSKYAVPFDNQTSANGIALVNPLSYKTITIFLTFLDEQGNRFYIDSLDLGPMQHTSFDLATKYHPSAGVRGVVQIQTSDFVCVLALRFFNAAFTSLLPLNIAF